MWTTNPDLASLLASPEDGNKYTQMSNVKVDWLCPECKIVTKNKEIGLINYYGSSCPACSDNVPYGEKFMHVILQENNIEFEYDVSREQPQGKRYDFYLSKYNWIVEVHGKQHSNSNGFNSLRERNLEEEQENDRLKEELAKKNRIDKYIVVDAIESSLGHLYQSVIRSELVHVLPNIDLASIGKRMASSFVLEVCKLWEEGVFIKDIATKAKLTRSTVRAYLKRGRDAGLCEYDEEFIRTRGKKEIVQISLQGEKLKIWKSTADAARYFKISEDTISRCARGSRNTSAGFQWMYKDDYDSHTKKGLELTPLNISDSNISSVCRRKTAGGFKWMYKEDYEKEFGAIVSTE